MAFRDLLGAICERFNWLGHAYCLMTSHYHLLVETPDANLSKGMHHLNGVFTQYVNRTHSRVGHLFQGRFKCCAPGRAKRGRVVPGRRRGGRVAAGAQGR